MDLFQLHAEDLFRADSLAWVMSGLIVFVIINVRSYAMRYLAGDRFQRWHRFLVLVLGGGVLAMVFANHLLVLLAGWMVSNLTLVRLMIHKGEWRAARYSGWLAFRSFGLGFVLLGAGFWLLAESAGTASIEALVQQDELNAMGFAGLLLVAIAALIQSAAWPFHGWLTSSLNAPTPVSALMHAGIVNGGGFLLVRLAPLFAGETLLMHALFILGLATAVVGTFWKLLQTDIKRMLACSTMGQMGFMLMQCGMGLWAPAISHLCWHGLFKAYLFLSSSSVVGEKHSIVSAAALSPARLVLASLSGLGGAVVFAQTSGIPVSLRDTSCLMAILAVTAAAQVSVGLLRRPLSAFLMLGTFAAGAGAGGLYGVNIHLIEAALGSLHLPPPQPLDAVYTAGVIVILAVWAALLFNLPARFQSHDRWKQIYVASLNASQPHPQTVTANRTAYQS
ncbi:MAG: proton-conducting membrane transporter [Candidatus Hydrogenedens sp.]|nr:proton-conducting membrane transporter [Candidatus Hydrogenedens sp.]